MDLRLQVEKYGVICASSEKRKQYYTEIIPDSSN